MGILHLVAAFTLLAPGTVAAQAPSASTRPSKPGEQVTVTGEQPERSKLVCERFVPTGSIKSETICKSRAEFDQIRADGLNERDRLIEYRYRMRQICMNRDPPTC